MIQRRLYIVSVLLVALAVITSVPAAAASVSWGTSSDWDNAASDDSVVHESSQYTDNDNASNVKLGYSTQNPLYSNSLVAYYPLQEDKGSTAYDFSGNNNDGSISGATVNQSGLLDTSAYSFSGSGDNVDDMGTQLDGDNKITLSFWVRKPNFNTDFELGPNRDGTNLNTDRHFNARFRDTGKVEWNVYNDANTGGIASTDALNTDQWHHIVGTWDGSTVKVYRDGVFNGSGSVSGSFPTSTQPLRLSGNNGGFNTLEGKLADVRIYDRALSSNEISSLYNVTAGYIKPQTRTFGANIEPDLVSSAELNGKTIDVTVTGSPTGTPESHAVSLNGSGGPYDIGWSNSHNKFSVNASLSTNNISTTPILQSLSLDGDVIANTYNVTGSITNNSGDTLKGITVDAVNQSSGNVDGSTTTDSNGDYKLELTNTTYNIRAYGTGYTADTQTVTVNGADISNVDLTPTTDAPTIDDSTAIPKNTYINSSTTTLSIDVDDAQYGSLGDEKLTVEFFDGAGNSLSTDTVTSAGTASSGSVSTPKDWYAVATDAANLSHTSSVFTITKPPDVKIYNESGDNLLSTTAYLDVESLDSSYSDNISVNNGQGNIDPPSKERLHVVAKATGYVDRDFLLMNYTRNYPLVMLPTTDADSLRYEQCYDLVDNTGNYPPAKSFIIIQTEVDSKNTSYPGMVSSGYFGSENQDCAFLVNSKPYTLVVQNNDGDAHSFGDYIAQNDGTIETLNIGPLYSVPIEPGTDIDPGRYASILRDQQNDTVSFEYVDHSGNTTELDYQYTKINSSGTYNVSNDTVTGQFGSYKDTQTVTEPGVNWRVNYTAKKNNTVVESGVVRSGGLQPIDGVSKHIDQKWLELLSLITIVALGGLIVPSDPRLAGTTMALTAIVLTMFGWIDIPYWALGPATATALIFQVAGTEGSNI